jgi:hypothetical protein
MSRDHYASDMNAVIRLVSEWKKYGKIVIAYDFDNTVFDYHNEGHTYPEVIELLRQCNEFGAYLVVYSSSTEDRYPFIMEYLDKNNIPYDSINETMPALNLPLGGKLYYNILLDDRAGLKSAIYQLKTSLRIMRGE